jgi:Outer membrane phospholipase A
MKRLLSSSLLLFSLVFAAGQTAFAQQAAGDNGDAPAESAAGNDTAATAQDKARQQREACLLRAAQTAGDDVTLEQLRGWCDDGSGDRRLPHEDALRARLALEETSQENPFAITPYKRNYLMPYSHWSNPQSNDPDRTDENLDSEEVKFQISLKAPVYDDFWNGSTVYMAFTGVFFLAGLQQRGIAPFREINFTPEGVPRQTHRLAAGPVAVELLAFRFRMIPRRDEPTSAAGTVSTCAMCRNRLLLWVR